MPLGGLYTAIDSWLYWLENCVLDFWNSLLFSHNELAKCQLYDSCINYRLLFTFVKISLLLDNLTEIWDTVFWIRLCTVNWPKIRNIRPRGADLYSFEVTYMLPETELRKSLICVNDPVPDTNRRKLRVAHNFLRDVIHQRRVEVLDDNFVN